VKELVEYMARGLVDNADAVVVEEFKDRGTTVLELRVAPDEVGRVIGREGKVANAMRTLLRVAGNKQRKRAVLEIGD
jgi:hypothetical protein